MGNINQNSIVNVTITNPSLYPELNLPELPAGAQYTRYENVPLTGNAMANAVFNTPIYSTKFNISLGGNLAYQNSKTLINKEVNNTDNINGGGFLRFTFRIEKFDFSLNGRANVNKAYYSLRPNQNILYHTLSGGADFNWTIVKGLMLSSDFSYQKQSGYSDNYNPQTFMWNAQLSYTFGKRNEWTMRLKAIDMLNNNVNVVRNVNSQYLEDIRYNSLGRYLLFGVTYNLNATLAKSEQDKAIESFRSGEPPTRGRMMPPPPMH
jgi:hypothetical protein